MRRKISAIVMVLALVGVAMLYAATSWNGFSISSTKSWGGGQGYLTYPALLAGESATMTVRTFYDCPPYEVIRSGSVNGPCSAGLLEIGACYGGEDPIPSTWTIAYATCNRGGQTGYISDEAN